MHKKTILAVTVIVAVLLSLTFAQPAFTQQTTVEKYWSDNYGTFNPQTTNEYKWSVLAKAPPDECFFGLRDPNNIASFENYYPNPLPSGYTHPCSFGTETNGIPKVNQAYIWGLTKHGKDLWFGTISNTLCLVIEELALGQSVPLQENTLACEGSVEADFRPPHIYLYDTENNTLTDMTPQVLSKSTTDKDALLSTVGLRSAGSFGDVVILGGINAYGGVTMFAFNAKTKLYIGTETFSEYSNVRQWIVVNRELYVGVANGTQSGLFSNTSGLILHWIGDTTNPFNFEQVGRVLGDPAYLTHFNDSLFVSTWGGPSGSYGTALFMSPQFKNKLPASTATWPTVWQLSDFEAEPSAGAAGGAIAGFDGWLYFTTMTPPGAQLEQFNFLYPSAPTDTASLAEDFLGSYRPTEMFRGKNFGTPNQKIELLYGNNLLPKYDPGSNTWSLVPNNLNQSPKWGLAGYNNFFNSYTWWMQKFNGELFIGTFDWSYLLFESVFDQYGSKIPPAVIAAARSYEGADLLRLHSSSHAPVAVSLDGMGNFSNYGIRTMVKLNGNLYLGTANPFNLLTDPTSSQYDHKLGGWELIRLWPNINNECGPDDGDDNGQ
jgi:hypothetical protein